MDMKIQRRKEVTIGRKGGDRKEGRVKRVRKKQGT
jgi:hypothetical protein